jgi:dimethylaniline monooxygenase (N-oxide forming)
MDLLNEGKSINVIRAAIESASGRTISLSNGDRIDSDAVVFATGWDVGADVVFDPKDRIDLGLATPADLASEEYLAYWKDIDIAADKFVLDTFPILKNPPKVEKDTGPPKLPYRLFRYMVPSAMAARQDRSLIFLGLLANATVPTHAEVSSLWGIAYLEGQLPDGACEGALGDKLAMDKDIATNNAFMARRYPVGERAPSAAIEIHSVVDRLMKDLSLEYQRKKVYLPAGFLGLGGWYREYFEPYLSEDYKGIVKEFLDKSSAADKKNR